MGKKPVKYSMVDGLTGSAFKGNPAAVCLLEGEREDEWLQSVAREFNISITDYLTLLTHTDNVSTIPRFGLRWFTPVAEVNLCGHATLAASHYLFTSGLVKSNIIEYSKLSGNLTAKKVVDAEMLNTFSLENGEAQVDFLIELDFPVVPLQDYDFLDIHRCLKLSVVLPLLI